ncbi:hemerythrin superfamily protein [Catenulispora sp. GAS73]|uniref:hemerythrin domain-containing protein n=1 Tax=Catenulispora sp. GAS73 TaxID=3156269 RepID=UPI00351458C4
MNENAHDDVIAVLTHDHREVQALFAELDETRDGADPQQRKDLVDRATIELVRHSTAEEQLVYPTVRLNVDGGAELADHELSEHAQIERSLKELNGMQPGDEPFEATLEHLIELVNAHIAEEEQVMFPRLRAVCTEEDLVEIGKMVTAAKKLAPTRPRPGAPDTPPGNLTAPALGLIDRIRDAFSGRGRGA